MKCPVCSQNVDDLALECRGCGESLASWKTLLNASHLVRQRGLQQAAQQDYLGATLSFLEAALTNPLQSEAWLDAARGLVHLNRVNEAVRLLQLLQRRAPQSGANQMIEAIQKLVEEAAQKARAAPPAPPAAAAAEAPAAATEASPAAPSSANGAASEDVPAPAQTPVDETTAAAVAAASATEADSVMKQPLLGLPPMTRKTSKWNIMGSGKNSDPLWEAVLASESRKDLGPVTQDAWLQSLAVHGQGQTSLFYLLGLDCWQKGNPAEALNWFVRTVQSGSPYLNPVGYVLVCARGEPENLNRQLQQLKELGIKPEEIRQVVQELRSRWGGADRPEVATRLNAVEQVLQSM